MENTVAVIVLYVSLFSQLIGVIVVVIGMIKAFFTYIRDALLHAESAISIQESRAELGHSFSLGLGFLIGASILKTTVAPAWNDIGQLAAIIAIRTALNYFLMRDIHAWNKTTSERQTEKKASGDRDSG